MKRWCRMLLLLHWLGEQALLLRTDYQQWFMQIKSWFWKMVE
jgi:hypothetical protein